VFRHAGKIYPPVLVIYLHIQVIYLHIQVIYLHGQVIYLHILVIYLDLVLHVVLQSAVSREKNRSANLSAALDLARAQALEEIENEKRLVSQLKQDLESRKVRNCLP